MRFLYLVLTTVVAFATINNGIAFATKPALSSVVHDTTPSRQLESNEAASEERKGGRRGRRATKGRKSKTRTRYSREGDEEDEEDESAELPPGAYFGENFGGPNGDGFSDVTMVKSGQKVLSINLRVAERVDAVILTVVSPSGGEATLFHGGNGGDLKTPLTLAEGEYITTMEAHSGKHNGHTRVKYVKFTTNKGNFIEGGTQTDSIGTDTAREGYQLSGFIGRSGDELDMVGAIWTSIQPVV